MSNAKGNGQEAFLKGVIPFKEPGHSEAEIQKLIKGD
jgi:hypothetical protein